MMRMKVVKFKKQEITSFLLLRRDEVTKFFLSAFALCSYFFLLRRDEVTKFFLAAFASLYLFFLAAKRKGTMLNFPLYFFQLWSFINASYFRSILTILKIYFILA